MGSYVLRPIADTGPNIGSVVPPTPSTHWDKVDDEPHDGTTTRLTFAAVGRNFFQWDTSVIPAGETVTSLLLRWAGKKGGGTGYQARVGLRIGGVEYWAVARTLPEDYTVFDEDDWQMASPADGEAWTPARLGAAEPGHELTVFDVALPRPDLTNLVGIVETVSLPVRPTGTPASVAARAAVASGVTPAAVPANTGPGCDVSAPDAATASPEDVSGGAAVAPQAVPSGTPAAVGPKSAVSDPGKPTATAAAVGPTATPSSQAPTAVLSVPTRSLGDPS